MSYNSSLFGLKIRLLASITFPAGFEITQFGSEADPFDFPSIQIGDSARGANGHLEVWQTLAQLKLSLNVIATGPDGHNLARLFEANRASAGKRAVGDVITVSGVYANGDSITLTGGICTNFVPGNSGASSGKIKNKIFQFDFDDCVVTFAS